MIFEQAKKVGDWILNVNIRSSQISQSNQEKEEHIIDFSQDRLGVEGF